MLGTAIPNLKPYVTKVSNVQLILKRSTDMVSMGEHCHFGWFKDVAHFDLKLAHT